MALSSGVGGPKQGFTLFYPYKAHSLLWNNSLTHGGKKDKLPLAVELSKDDAWVCLEVNENLCNMHFICYSIWEAGSWLWLSAAKILLKDRLLESAAQFVLVRVLYLHVL